MSTQVAPNPTIATREDPMVPRVFKVQSVRRETADTSTLALQPVPPARHVSGRAARVGPGPSDGAASCAFSPGQFNMVYVFGVGEIPISISGSPRQPQHFIHTTRVVGAVTKALCGLKRGAAVGVRGPFGSAWPLREAEGHDVVIVAGGIGLAPLRPAVLELMAHRDRYGRIALLYGTRSPEDMLFRKELERWRGRFDLEVHVTVDRATAEWRGHVGVVTALFHRATFDPSNTMAMMCGPEVMMRFSARELIKRGATVDRIFASMERNMKCAIGTCGHCQFGPMFICKNGPVLPYSALHSWIEWREI